MIRHSGQFKRVGGEKHVFPSFHEAADAVQVYLSEVPRGNCRAKAEGDNLKTVESTLSQIRRRRARGTSGLWPSSP